MYLKLQSDISKGDQREGAEFSLQQPPEFEARKSAAVKRWTDRRKMNKVRFNVD
jgi:hypothetical protein